MTEDIRTHSMGRRQLIGAAAALVAVPSVVAAAFAQQSAQQPQTSVTLKTTNDLKFVPNEFTISVNTPVTVTLDDSAGALPHNISIDDHNQKSGLPNLKVSVNVAPGQTAKGTVTAPQPGDYYFYCNVPGHEAAGMFGTMHVVAGGQGAASATPAGTPSGTPGATPAAAGAGGAATEFTVHGIDINFTEKQLTAPANTDLTFHFINTGALQHNMHILNAPGDPKCPIIDGGKSADFKANLPAGTYEYQCDVPGHAEAGMVGQLTVQ